MGRVSSAQRHTMHRVRVNERASKQEREREIINFTNHNTWKKKLARHERHTTHALADNTISIFFFFILSGFFLFTLFSIFVMLFRSGMKIENAYTRNSLVCCVVNRKRTKRTQRLPLAHSAGRFIEKDIGSHIPHYWNLQPWASATPQTAAARTTTTIEVWKCIANPGHLNSAF